MKTTQSTKFIRKNKSINLFKVTPLFCTTFFHYNCNASGTRPWLTVEIMWLLSVTRKIMHITNRKLSVKLQQFSCCMTQRWTIATTSLLPIAIIYYFFPNKILFSNVFCIRDGSRTFGASFLKIMNYSYGTHNGIHCHVLKRPCILSLTKHILF